MGDIYEFDNHNEIDPKLLFDSEINKQMSLLKDSIWFHGVIGRAEAENRIFNNGEFLVRFSEDTTNKFVVSSKWNGKHIHIIILTKIDNNKNCFVYFINSKFQFPTVLEVIKFHKDNQYPLSDTSEAVLYKPIDPNHIRINNGLSSLLNQRESKFRKSTNMYRKTKEKKNSPIPRCGSETYLTKQRFSETNFPELNKSLINLNKPDSDAPHKPKKPSFKLLNSKHLLNKLRPSNIKIRNKKLYKETGDYSDYSQVKDTEGALKREQFRRGFSAENRSPSLFGLNSLSSSSSSEKETLKKKKNSLDQSILRNHQSSDYVMIGKKEESIYVHPGPPTGGDEIFFPPSSSPQMMTTTNNNDNNNIDRDSTATLTAAPTPRTAAIDKESFDIYGLSSVDSPTIESCTLKPFGMSSFINFTLATHQTQSIGPIQSASFDKFLINNVASILLSDVNNSNNNNNLVFCKHLLDELRRLFVLSSLSVPGWRIGYRSIFFNGSDAFRRDLLTRQTGLTLFIMSTIVSTTSTEKRINLIFFWIKCADYLLTHIQDMYHFRAVFSAIFSEQILKLRVWKLVYRQDPSLTHRMTFMKEAVKSGCLLKTDIDNCVPDFVHLCNVFFGDEDDLSIFSKVSFDISMWSDQAFSSPMIWLNKISQKLESITMIPFYQEIVQTETLLCLILGKSSVNHLNVADRFDKANYNISAMVELCNDGKV